MDNANGKDNVVQQAQIWAQEARTQKAIVHAILRNLGLPEESWNAETLVAAHVANLRNAALEEAAKICDNTYVEPGDLQVESCHVAAAVIRAMKTPVPTAIVRATGVAP